jgi:hypothetical protein
VVGGWWLVVGGWWIAKIREKRSQMIPFRTSTALIKEYICFCIEEMSANNSKVPSLLTKFSLRHISN